MIDRDDDADRAMRVFFVPLGRERLELYYEAEPRDPVASTSHSSGWFARLQHRFDGWLMTVERREAIDGTSRMSRLWQRMLAWLAEQAAEQRLLWHLQRHDRAVLNHPADLSGDRALDLARGMLKRDASRHRIRMALTFVGFLLALPLTPLPGPNLITWPLAFLSVGHLLAWQGARRGLTRVRWDTVARTELAELRAVIGQAGPQRAAGVERLAAALGLQRLASFVERLAPRPA